MFSHCRSLHRHFTELEINTNRTRIAVIMRAPKNVPKLVLAAAVTSITIAGTLYGAGVKTEQEVTQV